MPGNKMPPKNTSAMRRRRAAPAMPPIGASVASGNRMSRMNADDLRGVIMTNEGPMSPNDLAAMRMYGKKGR